MSSSPTEAEAEADHQLISKLFELSKEKGRLVRTSTYKVDPDVTVRSWKMDEYKYFKVPSLLPTLARGLFSARVSEDPQSEADDEDAPGKHKIVTRGYDKFFNIGEVPWTTWAALEKHTSAPYIMTLKSNGCIIFIAALSPTKLLVTSKHSTGPLQNVPISHAQMGERWLLKHLKGKGKTTEQLARVLWDTKCTAVAELCDDSFEEHVLAYSSEKTGLHLHGINKSSGAFKTLPSDEVAEFAREWGFIETPHISVNSIVEVQKFSDQIAESGKWNGEAIEGFVVRCHVASEALSDRDAPPYPPGSSFFFKVKYDEPYMMYRDWREITKAVLSLKDPIQEESVFKRKQRRPENKLYLKWVRNEIIQNRQQFDGFAHGKGIIATRERFLQWMQSDAARTEQLKDALESMDLGGKPTKEFGKTIIVPVAIPGCGKTVIAVALQYLFRFGHIQSDDIPGKKSAFKFINKVVEELKTYDVVVADKNNHLKQHREQLRKAVEKMSPPVRLMALYWPLDKPPAMVHRICGDRDAITKNHEKVVWTFLQDYQDLDDNEVDEVIEMDLEEDLGQSLDRAVDSCVRILGVEKPTREAIGQALAAARGYTPTTKGELKIKVTDAETRFYGLSPEVKLEEIIQRRLAETDANEAAKEFWETLVNDKRVKSVSHITLVHKKELPVLQNLWNRCHSLFINPSPPMFFIELGHLLYDGRVMAISVEELRPATNSIEDTSADAIDFMNAVNIKLKNKLHLTVGTRSDDVNPFEARSLVEKWQNRNVSEGVGGLLLKGIIVKGRS
ncbi:RNA ligase-domain-containing protein [Phellopilus nigrolimitatus]|nr:RNA ligase-domain-containing protein [Phellopilus nigrolimitatus]